MVLQCIAPTTKPAAADDYYDQGIRYQEVIDGMAYEAAQPRRMLSMVSDSITIALPNALISADSSLVYKPDSEALDFSKELVALEGGK